MTGSYIITESLRLLFKKLSFVRNVAEVYLWLFSNPLITLTHMKPHRLHCTTDLFSGNCDGF